MEDFRRMRLPNLMHLDLSNNGLDDLNINNSMSLNELIV